MPGTIQVSVLDLLDFPSSSSSTISIKVSMGKKEFQTWDTGDFSFPLRSLRENIVVTIHDTEGKVLSRTGVETVLVIEKGTWDEFFALEGGGRLHMKLQFILSNVERKRIQELREIALKKKQEELLISKARHLETAALATVRGTAESSSMSLNHEVTDSSESLVQMEAGSSGAESLRNPDSRREDEISGSFNGDIKDSTPGTGDSHEILLDRLEEPIRSDVDGREGALSTVLVTEEPQIRHAKAEKQVIDKIKPQVPPVDVSTSSGEENLSTDVLSEELQIPAGKLHEKFIDKNETRIPPDTPTRAILSSEASDTQSIDHSVSDTIEVDRNLNKSRTMLPPVDIPATPISSLEELDSHSGKHLVPRKFEEDLAPNEDKTPESPLRRISSLEELDSHLSSYSISTKFEEERSLNKNETLIPHTDIPVRRISSLKDLGNHSSSSKFGRVQMLNKSKMLIPPTDVLMRRISSHEDFGDHSCSSKLEGRVVISEKSDAVKRSPSNVRKMISAFETSQAKGQAIRADPPIIRTQPMKSRFNITPAEQPVKEVTIDSNRTMQTEETGSSSSSIMISKEVHLQKNLDYVRETKDEGLEKNGKEARHAHETSEEASKELSSTVKSQERNLQESACEFRQQIPVSLEQDGRDELYEQQPSQEQLMEAATSPKQVPAASSLFEKPIIVESACDNTKLIEDYRANKYSGRSGNCISTDESRPLCVTSGSKQLMNLLGASRNCSETDRQEKSSFQTEVTNEQNLYHNTRNEVQKIGKASGEPRKSNLEGQQNVFEGLIGQAGKVAAIVAFGALVIFARER